MAGRRSGTSAGSRHDNGLVAESRLMVDKITTAPKSKLGAPIGRLSDKDLVRLNQAILVFLGLAASPRARR
jgi:mRNA interferase MazF